MKRTYLIIRSCLFRILNRQFLIFLFFLVLSSAFWLFQSLDEEYEEEFTIPLRLINVPENVVITTELPRELRVYLKDKGSALLNYRYGKKFSTITVDFETYRNQSWHVRMLSTDLSKHILLQLASTTRLVTMRPDTLEYYYNYGLCKRVPVRIQGSIQAERFYTLSSVVLKPDSVTVYASTPMFDTITAAYTQPIYISNLNDTMSLKTNFVKIRGAKFDPSDVKVSLFVDQITEKKVQVPIKWVNFPATKMLRTFPSKVTITFQVGMSMYRRINADNFVIVVNYEELLKNKSNKCRVSLKSVPAGASHVRIHPQEVEYLIEEIVPDA
ncbi:MAG: YbbR-like domain-containing protein [Bacteroidaceae bacterium]